MFGCLRNAQGNREIAAAIGRQPLNQKMKPSDGLIASRTGVDEIADAGARPRNNSSPVRVVRQEDFACGKTKPRHSQRGKDPLVRAISQMRP